MARAPVSKTGGWGFESLYSCQPHLFTLVFSMAYASSLATCRSVELPVCLHPCFLVPGKRQAYCVHSRHVAIRALSAASTYSLNLAQGFVSADGRDLAGRTT